MGTTFRSLHAVDCETKPYPGSGLSVLQGTVFHDRLPVLAPIAPLWAETLRQAIETDIIPLLLFAQREAAITKLPAQRPGHPSEADVAAFVDLIIADDMEGARAVADRVIVLTGGRDALLHELLTPAAHLLGAMWERDDCDFTMVTLGVYRLDQIMKETLTVGAHDDQPAAHGRTILLVPAPGEQHSFGLNMVADVFREGGWCVRSGAGITRSKLVHLASQEWFDIVGLSVSSERAFNGLPSCIRAVRQASGNPDLGIFVGGRAMIDHPERTRFLGADGTANDPRQSLRDANIFVEATVTERLQQSKTKLVDIG